MVMERTSVSLLLVAVTASFSLSNAQESSHAFNFDGCDVTEYYAKLSSTDASKWNRNEVQGLLQATHRHSLLYTNTETPGVDDVWAALMDVDVGTVPDTVQLLYGPTAQMEAIPFGQRTWIKEHVHPVLGLVETDSNTSLADGDLGKDITDMHNIFPASVLSETVRAQKYFGECGYLTESPQLCQQPAEGSSEGTCSCQDVYTPPEDKKGDIARALMYMDLRYDGSDPMTVDLKLSDCPRTPFVDMGYLSQMLTWHLQDPPTAEEIERNDKICQHWQGNRNPFVDHPEIAQALYYQPFELPSIGERTTYEACDKFPTPAPTSAPNACDSNIQPTDIYFFLLNSQDPDSIGMYTFANIPGNFDLFLTDNAWNGSDFVNDVPSSDGTLKLTTPETGIPAATAMGYHEDGLAFADAWISVQGNFSLTRDGEAVFLYCVKGDGTSKPLLAFSYGAAASNQTIYNETSSTFPSSLGEIGMQNIDAPLPNILFNVSDIPPSITTEALQDAMRDPDNWYGSNSTRYSFGGTLEGGEGAASSSSFCRLILTIISMASVLLLTCI